MTTNKWQEIERVSTQKAHKNQLDEMRAHLKQYQDTIEQLEKEIDVLVCLKNSPQSSATYRVKASSSKREAAAVVVASDWHVEERISSDSVNGWNEFNLEIADKRIETFTSTALKLIEAERKAVDVPVLVLALLGDFMSGYIHEELREENSLSPTETILWLKDRLSRVIRTFRKEGSFSEIVIPCSIGNHGRTTIKPRHATAYKNSYEWLLYKVLEQEFSDDITWVIGQSYHTFVNVFDRVLRFHHGDSLKYGGGIGGLTIPVEKAIASWNKAKVADLDVFGHWHTSQQNPKWVSNGSLIGFNSYAVSIKAAFELPQQTFFLFDKKYGRTGTWPIFVGD